MSNELSNGEEVVVLEEVDDLKIHLIDYAGSKEKIE